jgi:selenocysteine lyase/cysteine desulfurase
VLVPKLPTIPIETLIGNDRAFPVLREWNYFNHAGVCPLPAVAAEALRQYAAEAERGAYLNTDWYPRIERLRDRLGELIGADRSEIALLKNTSEGLATVAQAIEWHAGDRIITTASEYPSNLWPWQQVARERGLEVVVVPEEQRGDGTVAVDEDRLLAEVDHPRARLLAVSHVQFATGQVMDAARLGAVCRGRGVYFCLDAIQSVGVIPVDVRGLQVDFLAADGHKWMLGPEGAGCLYVRRERLGELRTPMVGWNSARNALAFDASRFELKDDASRFECGTLTIPAYLSLLASVELLLGVGVESVSVQVRSLVARLAGGLEASGWQVITPSLDAGILSLTHRDRGADELKRLCVRLRKEHRTELAVRSGRLRASPHFYNVAEQMDHLASLLRA